MKKCLQCTKQATLHITEIRSGKSVSLHLCESCAKSYLNNVEVGGIPDEFESPIQIGGIGTIDSDTPESGAQACPTCGITFKQFRSQGRLGCAYDYELFRKDLLPILESIHHGETQHVGKIPPKVSADRRQHHELIRLRSELQAAINDENYELAAELRDQIRGYTAEEE